MGAKRSTPDKEVVVWEQRSVVAMLAMSQGARVAWIEQLYVLPGFESRGIGSKLLEHAHRVLRRPIRGGPVNPIVGR